ncbi:hypothetical protein OC834_002104 [Tilletia horrida]|uniref:3-beta hydroxysteroid dehydrogenase/isomerase domain-containing protein n=1 Tax=Tilletia horrida TaxID=155126 RepID=A0AAN6GDQ9_9BASI|nr:hypothetical protein OC842_004736 [Tilletia horrida]KAK0533775.1 hypothetical protein OC834_002104 [Tilletia horrida]
MAGDLVVITGITGFVATHVLLSTLRAPEQYRVRGTLRSVGKKQQILELLSEPDRARVEFAEVADTASSDLTEALKGATYVLHTASPYQIEIKDPRKELLEPAIHGTTNVLEYAAKEPSIKRVIITSSFAAVTDFKKGGPNRPNFTYKPSDWLTATEEDAVAPGALGALSYSVSKKLAEKAAWDFVEANKPHFDIATINPPMIYGPTLQTGVRLANLNTSSKAIYQMIASAETFPGDRLPLFAHVTDVADAHVLALSKPEAGGKRFLLQGSGVLTWGNAALHISTKHPELKSRLPKGWEEAVQNRKGEDQYAKLDTSYARDILGISFKDWEETLEDALQSLLELEKRPEWKQ